MFISYLSCAGQYANYKEYEMCNIQTVPSKKGYCIGDVMHKLAITSHMKQGMCYNREWYRFGWGISILTYY